MKDWWEDRAQKRSVKGTVGAMLLRRRSRTEPTQGGRYAQGRRRRRRFIDVNCLNRFSHVTYSFACMYDVADALDQSGATRLHTFVLLHVYVLICLMYAMIL